MPRRKQNIGKSLQTWVIKDVDLHTRTLVKLYAAATGLTTAQALKELVSIAMNDGGAARRLSDLTQEAASQMTREAIAEQRTAPEIIEMQQIPPRPSGILEWDKKLEE